MNNRRLNSLIRVQLLRSVFLNIYLLNIDMDRESLDLNELSQKFVKSCVLISHTGIDQNFSVYQHALSSYFLRTPLVWKKTNGQSFPHRLSFPLKFVPYEENLCFGPHISPTEITKIAYLHIFNISVTTVDEYRNKVRHNVSDWFVKLNSKPDVQWIIAINTSRAKDRKTKNAIMEKIKNDFAKYTNRLFELPDVSDQSALVSFIQGIQQFLWAHLNLVTEIWDSSLKTAYEKRKQHSWEPFSYFSSIIEYGKMFWSFGALEYAATIFDDLEQFLNDFGCKSGEQNSPRWIPQLLNTKLEDRPSLIASFSVQKFQKNEAHYLGMMNYLLCQQILMAIHLYQNKMKSLDAAPSLRSDCVFLIMKKSLATIESVKEFNNVMNNRRDIAMTCCWVWWTVSESLSICQLLCDVSHLNVAPNILARLQLARFDAIHVLAKQVKLNPNDTIDLCNWLKIKPSSESKVLISALESGERMCGELEKAHDVCVNALHNSNRHRCVLNTTFKLFSYLRSVNAKCPTQKLAIGRQALKTMPTQLSTAIMLKNVCKELLQSNSSTDELLSLILFISRCENGESSELNDLFAKKCKQKAEESGSPVDLRKISDEKLFRVQIEIFDAVQTTDSKLEIHCKVTSKMEFDLENCTIRLHFSQNPTTSVAQECNLSALSLRHDKKENICRLVSELKWVGQSQSSEESKKTLLVESELMTLKQGENTINFSTDITEIGCFLLEEVSICTPFTVYNTSNVISRRPPVLYCVFTPHAVSIVNESQHFFAGIMQHLKIEIKAMCDIHRETELEVEACTDKFQFFEDNEWRNSLNLTLEPFKSQETRIISVQIQLKIDSSICESAAVQKRSLIVKWMNRLYNLSLYFVPIMVITSKTSMLTKEIILEVEINRAAGPNITTIVNSAVLTAESPPALLVSNSDATATTESENLHVATPLTTFPIENRILSVVNMVWSLPTKGSLVKHRLCVVYTVKDESPSHEYTFDDYLELTVPHVQFEFCTQVLSQQPGAQLCRATSPCHFVISLRCLRPVSSTLLVVIDSDERIWTLVERTKMVTVKDSGLGQLALTIIPVVAGFLPFPEVAIYECQLVSESVIPGSDILCFNRTAGKQIRVLSNNLDNMNSGKENTVNESNRLTSKIVKLFD